ncbi:hypothetical protein Dimus_033935 [Dionaea muscipula]
MSRERESHNRDSSVGGWTAVLRKKFQGTNSVSRGRNGMLISLFVEDIPDAMDHKTLHKMFVRFGVVKDVFIPRKKSKTEKRFGFVQYGCSIVADTGGATNRAAADRQGFSGTNAVKAPVQQKYVQMVTGASNHHVSHAQMFKSVEPWSVNRQCSFEIEVWLCSYGIPMHAWNVDTFMAIGQHWGEVLSIEDDIVKCIRCDIGKVNISTSNPSVINRQMKLVVGWKSFEIRVAEEQSVFICNSNFNCSCWCHRWEDEQLDSGSMGGEDDDVEHGLEDRNTEIEGDNSPFLSAGVRDNINGNSGYDWNTKNLGEYEMRGFHWELIWLLRSRRMRRVEKQMAVGIRAALIRGFINPGGLLSDFSDVFQDRDPRAAFNIGDLAWNQWRSCFFYLQSSQSPSLGSCGVVALEAASLDP